MIHRGMVKRKLMQEWHSGTNEHPDKLGTCSGCIVNSSGSQSCTCSWILNELSNFKHFVLSFFQIQYWYKRGVVWYFSRNKEPQTLPQSVRDVAQQLFFRGRWLKPRSGFTTLMSKLSCCMALSAAEEQVRYDANKNEYEKGRSLPQQLLM